MSDLPPDPVLDAELRPGETERGDGFVDRAVGLGPGIVLADALATEEEPGGAVVAAARGNRRVEGRGALAVGHGRGGRITT